MKTSAPHQHLPADKPPRPARIEPAVVVILAGVCAALHVGKLPPALPALREAMGLTLVEAGFLLSLVQAAGMLLGVWGAYMPLATALACC